MRASLFAFALLASTPAIAAGEPPAPSPACATVKDCQKVIDDLNARLTIVTMQATALRNQRINAQAAADDANVNAAIQSQIAAQKQADPPKPK